MTANQLHDRASVDHFRLGLLLAVGSALSFGSSGPFAKSLMEAGWSPDGRRHRAPRRRRPGDGRVRHDRAARLGSRSAAHMRRPSPLYGVIPIAGAQLFYYNAVSHLSVGVALLLEYTAPILVVAWVWATTRRRPTSLTLAASHWRSLESCWCSTCSAVPTSTSSVLAGRWPLQSAPRATS